MTKTLCKLGIEGILLHLIQTVSKKSTTNIIPKDEKLKAFLLGSGMRPRCPISSLLFKHHTGVLVNEKEMKGTLNGREEIKLFLSVKRELISDYSKVTGYKINR